VRKELAVRLNSLYPVLLTDEVEESSRFFTQYMGFKVTFKSDWYVSLIHSGNDAYELAIISYNHDTIPAGFRQPTSTLLLNFEVPSVESEYERLRAAGVEILQPIEDLPAGQRHFICRGPGSVMVDVIEVVPPDPEYASQYVS
jgi:catechol 2,3-dioxygenase-like lactoylglutathione lyase family enzyme